MQITLLPQLLPSEGVTSVQSGHQAFTPGTRILATVLGTGLEGGTMLSFAGRHVPTGGALPYPPGTTLRLEVVEGGPQPLLRLVAAEAAAVAPPAPPTPPVPSGPPVSTVTYGLAAAVMAAQTAPDVRQASLALAQWLPALVAGGLLTPRQAETLLKALGPVQVGAASSTPADGVPAGAVVARALAERVADGGLLLERRLADVLRQARPDATAVATRDVRAQLAVVAHLLDHATGMAEARTAVTGLQDALLAEQARAAAHLARDGVVDVRIPLQVQGQDAEMRLRMRIARDAPDASGDDPAPWRQVRLDLALDGLGHVQVRLGVVASQVRAEFFVEHAGTADLIEAGLADLGGALEGVGFAQVLSRVVVDPVTACAPDDLPELPPQRAILDIRA